MFGIKWDSLILIKTVPLSTYPEVPKFDKCLLRNNPKSICLKIETWSPEMALPSFTCIVRLHECRRRGVGKQGQGVTVSASKVDGVALKINSVHVCVSAHSNHMPGNSVLFAHVKAWLVAVHISINS